MKIKILSFAKDSKEMQYFSINRPAGVDHYTFMFFHTPITIFDNTGMLDCDKDSCILYTPGFRQCYSAPNNNLVHDFLCFSITDKDFFDEINFPMNQLFYPKDCNIIVETMSTINSEIRTSPLYFNEIIDTLAQRMFIKLSRDYQNKFYIEQPLDSIYESFCNLRNDIYLSPQEYTVNLMAKKINYSSTYFTGKYKKYFNVSPQSDLTNAKKQKITELFRTKSPQQISDYMHFDSIYNFYKWIKKNFGMTPNEVIVSLSDNSDTNKPM